MRRTTMMGTIGMASAALLLAACAGTAFKPLPHLAPYHDADLASAATSGTATVTGQAFLKTRGGDVKYGAGNPVYLLPVSPYTTELFRTEIVGGRVMTAPDPGLGKYQRAATADGTGHFTFTNVPAGQYYVYSLIQWEIPGQYGLETTGGYAYSTVAAVDGETANVVATQ